MKNIGWHIYYSKNRNKYRIGYGVFGFPIRWWGSTTSIYEWDTIEYARQDLQQLINPKKEIKVKPDWHVVE